MKPLPKPAGIVIHHSLTRDGQVVDWDAIKRYHMTAPEYRMDDIGYHAGVERINGVLTSLTGRPINCQGGHTKGHNDMWGICIVGNFDAAPPDPELLQYASVLTAGFLRMAPHLGIRDIHRHSEFAPKTCPGKLFPWDEFLRKVEGAL